MSDLVVAVARAIASARQERQWHPPIPKAVHDGERWHDVRYQRVESQAETDARMAAAAVGVCLAEAQRSIEALVVIEAPVGMYGSDVQFVSLRAVLAALGEQRAG